MLLASHPCLWLFRIFIIVSSNDDPSSSFSVALAISVPIYNHTSWYKTKPEVRRSSLAYLHSEVSVQRPWRPSWEGISRPPCFMLQGEPCPALKVTGKCLTVTHKPFLLWASRLYPALFSTVLFSFPLLTGLLAAAAGLIHCPFCNKTPLNWGFALWGFHSYHDVRYTNRFSLLGFMSQVEVLMDQHLAHILL